MIISSLTKQDTYVINSTHTPNAPAKQRIVHKINTVEKREIMARQSAMTNRLSINLTGILSMFHIKLPGEHYLQ